MPETVYDIGDVATLVATLGTHSGDLINPTSLYLQVRWPDTLVTTFGYDDFTQITTGHWQIEISCLHLTGRYVQRWSSTGSGQAAEVSTFRAKDNLSELA
jgi:hypothetical protein